MPDLIRIEKGEPRVDTRLLASQLGIKHQNVYEMVKDYASDFEQVGKLRFQTGEIIGRGRPAKYALLTEDQCYLLLAFSRNTEQVRALKVRLVIAFREARAGQAADTVEYLPGYHALHDKVHALAGGSPNERFVHMNLNKLVNKTLGIATGSRKGLQAPKKALLIVAQDVASRALDSAKNHHDGYDRAKQALAGFGQALALSK